MGKWVKERLGAKSTISRGGSPRPIEDYVSPEFEGYNWIKIGDMKPGAKYIESTAEKMIPAGLTKTREVHAGDFLLSNSMSFGRPYISKIDGCIHDGWLAIQSYHETFDTNFLYYCLGAESTFAQYRSLAAGSTVLNLKKEMVAKVNVTYPVSLDEQRHIAEILTTCDEVIEKSEAVAEKYRAIKAGMLKDLFTRGIGKNGKLRPPPESAPQLYKDTALGKVPREWKIKTIGEMFAFKNGVSKGKEYFGHGVPIVNFTDVFNKPRITPDVLKGRVEMDRHEIDSFAVKSGDVFFTRTSETPEEIGMAAVVIGEFVDTVFSGFVLRGRPISEDLENEFKVFCFRTDAVRKRIIGDCSYTTRALTNGSKLSVIKMGVPSTYEQQRIAERLSAIDAKIADELAVVAKYRKVKTGLMARLLTPPDGEVE